MVPIRSPFKLVALVVVASLLSALVAGGLTSFVRASTPDATGKINGCYRTNGGDLRVIDTSNAADTCSNKETAISWDQNKTAIASSNFAIANFTDNGTLITSLSQNIVSADIATNPESPYGNCIDVSFTPKAVLGIGQGRSAPYIKGIDSLQDDEIATHCVGSQYDIWTPGGTAGSGYSYGVIIY